MKNWQLDKEWADTFWPEAQRITHEVVSAFPEILIEFREATFVEDVHEATDFVFSIATGEVAVRFRRPDYYYSYRDLTLRHARPSEVDVETWKIREGWARWYLYGWQHPDGDIRDYIWVDLNRLRSYWRYSVDLAPIKSNSDGSSTFKCIDWRWLYVGGCLVDWDLKVLQ